MIKENYETQKQNNQIRMDIIERIMRISTTRYLTHILAIAKTFDAEEIKERPMDIVDIANMIDEKDARRILKAVEKADMVQIAARQMKEAFQEVLS